MKFLSLLDLAFDARASTGKSLLAQFIEICRLRFSRTKLSAYEYYNYRLFQHSDFRTQKSYVGWRMGDRLQRAMTSDKWYVAAADKLIFGTLCAGFGLQHAESCALYASPNSRQAGNIPTFSTIDEIRVFLSSPQTQLPLWVKPVRSWQGIGGVGIATFDQSSDTVTLINGTKAQLSEILVPSISKDWPSGHLFQKLLKPHSEISRRCGNRLCTMRIWAVLERDGPRLVHAILRIPVGMNMIDNLSNDTGNSYGSIDIETGMVLNQTVLKAGYHGDAIYTHPDTGEEIVNFPVPEWEKAKDLCIRAALCFGGFRFQGWDIAVTDQGPVLVELNCPGDVTLLQIAMNRGLWDEAIDQILIENNSRM